MLSPDVLGHLLKRIRDAGKSLGRLGGAASGPLRPDKHQPYSPQNLPDGPLNLPGLKIISRPGPIIAISRTEKAYRAFSRQIALTAPKRAWGT